MALTWRFRWSLLLVLAPLILTISVVAVAQSPYFWIREHNTKHPSLVTRDPRFARDFHRFLALKHEGWGSARLASAYMSVGTDDGVHASAGQVTVDGCAPHAGECGFLWAPSKGSPVLVFCFMDPALWIYTSSQSDPSIPKELVDSIRAWRADRSMPASSLDPATATIVTRDGHQHPISVERFHP